MLVSLFRGRLSPDEWYPALEADLSARLVRLPGGEQARVVEGGDARHPPVLFIHGWGASAYYYRKLLPAVLRAGRESYCQSRCAAARALRPTASRIAGGRSASGISCP